MPDGRTSCPGEIAPMGGCPHGGTVSTFGRYKPQHSTCRTPESRGLGGRGNGAAAQKESAPIHRKSMVKPRRAAATDCQGPGRSPVCGGGVGLPPFRGHRGTARVPESPTRTPPPQSRYIGLPQDHPLRRTYFASGGPQPARPPDRPSPSAAAASRAEPLHFRSFDIPRRMSTHTPWRQPDGGAMDLCPGFVRNNVTWAPRSAHTRTKRCTTIPRGVHAASSNGVDLGRRSLLRANSVSVLATLA